MEIKKITCAVIFYTVISFSCYSQDSLNNSFSKNAVFFEAGGNGGLYSLNYDRIIHTKGKNNISIRGGLAFIPKQISGDANEYIILTELNHLHGINNKFFELGMGLTFFYETYTKKDYTTQQGVVREKNENNEDETHLLLFLRGGYRLQRQKGLFFRAAFTPAFNLSGNSDLIFFPWVGISIGKTF